MGTAGYMSPERCAGRPVDHRADIFALQAILYEMLAGKRAFQRATSAETITAILNDDPPGISQFAHDHSSRAAASSASLPGEESRATLSLCIGFGFCAGSPVRNGHLSGSGP